jgi:hypothetical protein
LDSDQHCQRANCPRISHGSLDRHSNDRLGRIRCRRSEHWWQILRGSTGSDPDANGYRNSNTDGNRYADGNRYGDTDGHAETYADAKS